MKAKTGKRLLSLLLVGVMTLGLTPTMAGAVEIQEGLPAITVGIPGNASPTVIGFGGKQWYVIGYNGSGVYSTANDTTVTLLQKNYGNETSAFDSTGSINYYSGSTLQSAMNTAYNNLASGEQALVNGRDLEGNGNNLDSEKIAGADVSGAKFWPLSVAEANKLDTSVLGYGNYWWLRSPGFNSIYAAIVNNNGSVSDNGNLVNNNDLAVRPAFNVNLASVIFTSAAVGGKSDVAVGDGLVGASAPTDSVKFTVKDEDTSNLNLDTVALSTATAKPGERITVTYENAVTGANKYVSCVLINTDGEVLYYGKLEDLTDGTSAGSASLTLPADLADGTYTLKVFNEEINDDYYTDFCSEPQELPLTVDSSRIGVGDTVYYGTYPQREYTPTTMPGSLTEGTTYTDDDGTQFVYVANPANSQGHYYKIEPIAWRVLENSSGELFLISEQNLDAKPYNTQFTDVTWETSTVRSWLNGYDSSSNAQTINYTSDNFIDSAFGTAEQAAINATALDNPSNGSVSGGNNTDDQIFFLSIQEATTTTYGYNYFTDNNDRIALNTGYTASYSGMLSAGTADYWWLRSPGDYSDLAAVVDDYGSVNVNGNLVDNDIIAVRPALNVNLASVIFTSAAVDGKSATVGSLSSAEPTTVAVKLTVKDAYDVSINPDGQKKPTLTLSSESNETATLYFEYEGASTGDNQYVSCVLTDTISGAVKYYGKLADCETDDSGIFSIDMSSIANGDYTLNIFSEQDNGDYYTDYAGEFVAVDLTVTNGNGTVSGADILSVTTPENQSVSSGNTASFAVTASGGIGTYTYQWQQSTDSGSSWTDISGATDSTYTTVATTTSMSGYQYRCVVADEATASVTSNAATLTVADNTTSTTYTITFDANGGSVTSETMETGTDGTLSALPTPTRSSYSFDGWYTAKSDGTQITTDTVFTSSTTVYAHWTYSGSRSGGSSSSSTSYTLTFETNGGSAISSVSKSSGTVVSLSGYTTTRDGYTFTGWYSDSALTTKVTSITLTKNTTVYAGWELTEEEEKQSTTHEPYILGYEDSTFRPDSSVTRAETAQLLYNISGASGAGSNKFSDVSSNQWYYNAVTNLTDSGVISGYTDGTFQPDNSITRAEFVTLVAKYAGLSEATGSSFTDVSSNHWANGYIAAATKAGYISGYTDGSFRPDAAITRAEAVTVFNAMLGREIDKDVLSSLTMPFSDVPTSHWAYDQILEASVEHTHSEK